MAKHPKKPAVMTREAQEARRAKMCAALDAMIADLERDITMSSVIASLRSARSILARS